MIKHLFHGTTIVFTKFKAIPTWFAESYAFAYDFTQWNTTDQDLMVIKGDLDLDKVKLFDPRDQKQTDKLRDILPDRLKVNFYGSTIEEISRAHYLRLLNIFDRDCWRYLEADGMIEKIRDELGYDGHISREADSVTYCIYDPVKAITNLKYMEELTYDQHNDRF